MTSTTLVSDEKELNIKKNALIEKLHWILKEVTYSVPG